MDAQRFTHRCAACGEYWWDAHVCPKAVAATVKPLDLSGVKLGHSDTQAALERDAARYRWLRDECSWTMVSGNGKSNLSIRVRAEFDLGELVDMVDEFDAAIDAAMKQ